jgi:hypothetical protein
LRDRDKVHHPHHRASPARTQAKGKGNRAHLPAKATKGAIRIRATQIAKAAAIKDKELKAVIKETDKIRATGKRIRGREIKAKETPKVRIGNSAILPAPSLYTSQQPPSGHRV